MAESVIYVDDAMTPFKLMKVSHMFVVPETDQAQLDEMALRIGLNLEWKHNRHFDVSLRKRELALKFGVVPVTVREGGRLRMEDAKTR